MNGVAKVEDPKYKSVSAITRLAALKPLYAEREEQAFVVARELAKFWELESAITREAQAVSRLYPAARDETETSRVLGDWEGLRRAAGLHPVHSHLGLPAPRSEAEGLAAVVLTSIVKGVLRPYQLVTGDGQALNFRFDPNGI